MTTLIYFYRPIAAPDSLSPSIARFQTDDRETAIDLLRRMWGREPIVLPLDVSLRKVHAMRCDSDGNLIDDGRSPSWSGIWICNRILEAYRNRPEEFK